MGRSSKSEYIIYERTSKTRMADTIRGKYKFTNKPARTPEHCRKLSIIFFYKFYYCIFNTQKSMKNRVVFNIAFNVLVATVFVLFNTWALHTGLEETFIVLAFLYGTVSIIGNALFIIFINRK